MEFISLFETSEAFTQTLMMTLPNPRFEAYQHANFDITKKEVKSYAN